MIKDLKRFFALVNKAQNDRNAAFTLAEGATHVGTCDKVCRSAFTLAEVLIVLAIIGVISVLTLPNVMQSYNNKVTVAQLQRTYNALRNGLEQYMMDQRADKLSDTQLTTDEGVMAFMNNYLNVTRLCASSGTDEYGEATVNKNAAGNCLASTYNTFNNTGNPISVTTAFGNLICGILESGSTICTQALGSSATMYFYIDVNGIGSPNRVEQDFFNFALRDNVKLLEQNGAGSIYSGLYCAAVAQDSKNNKGTYFHGCFNKIAQDGWQINYKF